MSSKVTCTPCRIKKVKCDGKSPQCGPCIRARKKLNCIYDNDAISKPKSKSLIKGQACLPCRRKKKRCSGTQPCESCHKVGKELGCTFEDAPPEISASKRVRRGDESSESGSTPPLGYISSPVLLRRVPSINVHGSLSPGLAQSDLFVSKDPLSLCDFPAFFFPDSHSSIAPNPFVPLSITDVEDPFAFALSDVSMDDLNMNFRLSFLAHRLSFGFHFTFAKQQAILLKDTSGTFIHPFFIHFAHMFGCHFFQERRFDASLTYLHSMHLQLCWESLIPMVEEEDPLTKAQCWLFMCSASIFTHNITRSKHYLRRCVEIVKRHKIMFVPCKEGGVETPVLEFTEENHERVVFLGQLLYWLMYLYLLDGHSEEFTPDLERQFRFELIDACPILFKVCPITIRVRTMLFAKDANSLIAQYNEHKTPTSPWLTMCRLYLTGLLEHIESLKSTTAEFTKLEDQESCLSLRFSSMIASTTLAELSHVLSRNPASTRSSALEFRERCSAALCDVAHAAQGLGIDDFRRMDPFLGICWSRALALFKNEPPESPLQPFIPQGCTFSSPRPLLLFPPSESSLDDEYLDWNDASPRAQSLNVLSRAQTHFLRIRFDPILGDLCKRMAVHDFRRNPDAPNYLREDVKRFYGL